MLSRRPLGRNWPAPAEAACSLAEQCGDGNPLGQRDGLRRPVNSRGFARALPKPATGATPAARPPSVE